MTQPSHKTCPQCQQPAFLNATACSFCGQTFQTPVTTTERSSFSSPTPFSSEFPNQTPPVIYQQPPYPGQQQYPGQQLYPGQQYGQPYPVPYVEQKSKVAAALLAFFLGGFGAHGFYLGNTTMGVTLLVITLVSFPLMLILVGFLGLFAVSIICLIQTIVYLCASDQDFHQKYVVEKRWI